MITVVNTNDSGAGSLRQAIADAAPGEVINFDAAALPVIALTSAELFIDAKALTIQGPGSGSLTVQRTSGSFRIFHIRDASPVTLSGLTLADGVADNGAGLLIDSTVTGPIVTLEDIVFNNNSATNLGGGINATDGQLTMTDCTFTNNSVVNTDDTGAFGGGVSITSVIDSMTGCIFEGNTASGGAAAGGGFGGGLHNDGTITLMEDCVFLGNTATGGTGSGNGTGGGINNGAGFLILVNNCTISNNVAVGGSGAGAIGASGSGGGIFNNFGTVGITNCTIAGNSAVGGVGSTDGGLANGGGYFEGFGTTEISYSTVSGNSASGGPSAVNGGQVGGGGLYDDFGTVTLNSSTVSGNVATGGNGGTTDGAAYGGGLSVNLASFTISNSTITDNTVSSDSIAQGDGIANIGGFIQFSNTIIVANTGTTDLYDDSGVSSFGHNCIGTTGGAISYVPGAGDQLGVTASALHLGPLQDNGGPTFTHALLFGSVARDAGDATGAPATDQRGFPRVVNLLMDVGAYEGQANVGLWSVQVASPFTGYVYVVDVVGGSYVPAYRFYSGVTTDQTNQDFVFTRFVVQWQNHVWVDPVDQGTSGGGTFSSTLSVGPASTTFSLSSASLVGGDFTYVNAQSGAPLLTYNGLSCDSICHFDFAKAFTTEESEITPISLTIDLITASPFSIVNLLTFDGNANPAGTYDLPFTVPDTGGVTKTIGIAIHIVSGMNEDVVAPSSCSFTNGYIMNA